MNRATLCFFHFKNFEISFFDYVNIYTINILFDFFFIIGVWAYRSYRLCFRRTIRIKEFVDENVYILDCTQRVRAMSRFESLQSVIVRKPRRPRMP